MSANFCACSINFLCGSNTAFKAFCCSCSAVTVACASAAAATSASILSCSKGSSSLIASCWLRYLTVAGSILPLPPPAVSALLSLSSNSSTAAAALIAPSSTFLNISPGSNCVIESAGPAISSAVLVSAFKIVSYAAVRPVASAILTFTLSNASLSPCSKLSIVGSVLLNASPSAVLDSTMLKNVSAVNLPSCDS